MSWVGYLLKDSELFILFAENSQILLKISVIPIILTFIYLVALYLLVNNQLNSSLRHIIVTMALPIFTLQQINYLEYLYTYLAIFHLSNLEKIDIYLLTLISYRFHP